MNRFSPNFFSGNRKSAIPNTRWLGFLVIFFMLVVAGDLAHAQSKTATPRIGVLLLGAPPNTNLDAFIQALRELHYVEGKNILIEYRFAEGEAERLPELARQLVDQKMDAIFTAGTPAIFALKGATKTIPFVFFSTSDPIGTGVVASLAQPGVTSRAYPSSLRTYGPSVLSCSRKSFPSSSG